MVCRTRSPTKNNWKSTEYRKNLIKRRYSCVEFILVSLSKLPSVYTAIISFQIASDYKLDCLIYFHLYGINCP